MMKQNTENLTEVQALPFSRAEFFEAKGSGAYAKSQWRAINKLTPGQRQKIEALKAYEGKAVRLSCGDRTYIVLVGAVVGGDLNGWSTQFGHYASYPYDVRVEPLACAWTFPYDGAPAECPKALSFGGFWTRRIDAMELIEE